MSRNKQVHFFMQGKGGVGKTTMAVFFAQFCMMMGRKVECYDLDPVNNSMSEFSALSARIIELMTGDEVNPRKFDLLMEALLTAKDDSLIDTGSSAFVPLAAYLIENRGFEQLIQVDRTVVVHVVIAGSQALSQTLSGFESIMTHFHPGIKVVVWLNFFWGPIEAEGLSFEHLDVFQAYKDRVIGIVKVPRKTEKTFLEDMTQMLTQKLTFDQALSSPKFYIQQRERLKIYRDLIFDDLRELDL